MDFKRDLITFLSDNTDLYVTEFARSYGEKKHYAMPQIRGQYILHFMTKGVVHSPEFTLYEGDAFLLARNMIHTFHFDENFDHYWVGFTGAGVENLLTAFNIPLHSNEIFKIDNYIEIKKDLDLYMQELLKTKNQLKALSMLLSFLPYLKRQKQNSLHPIVEQAKNFIDNNFQYDISITQLAKEIHTSEDHLYNLFKKNIGISPKQYLIKTRMNEARNLLINTSMSIKEISDNVGFSSPYAFSNAYKKYFDKSPNSHRK